MPENLSTDLYVAASAVGTALGSMVEQVAATQEGKDNVYSALLNDTLSTQCTAIGNTVSFFLCRGITAHSYVSQTYIYHTVYLYVA